MMKITKNIAFVVALLISFTTLSTAESAKTLEHDANMAINQFIEENKGGDAFLVKSKAFLIFPSIQEAGFFVGGKYGEGVLRVGRTTKGYYSITSASIGFQMGAQESAMIIAFTSDAALNKFLMADDEWDTDVDGKVAIAEWNSKEELDDVDFNDPMIAFVFDSKGMMGSFTLSGTKFEKIKPD